MTRGLGDYSPSGDGGLVGEDMLCLLVHGDAAVAGQGINQEIITMSNLPHYTVGGTVHFTIDNQVKMMHRFCVSLIWSKMTIGSNTRTRSHDDQDYRNHKGCS